MLCVRCFGCSALLRSYVLAVETENQFQVQIFNVVNRKIDIVVATVRRECPVFRPRGSWSALRLNRRTIFGWPPTASTCRTASRTPSTTGSSRSTAKSACALEAVSGIDHASGPLAFWQWWSEQTDTQLADRKSVVTVSEQDASVSTYTPVVMRVSCFAAGTPVWTEHGLQSIETLRVGDKVLAKDVETGELAYKVVSDHRAASEKELTTLRFAEESIVCTGGHRFWESGTGWIKARDLTTQMLLHTATGNTPVGLRAG